MDKVTAIVVTYNRKELLIECLDALLAQSVSVDNILVINNCSTDGTEQLFVEGEKYCLPQINVITTEKNLGGAGGFHRGIKLADATDCDWVWIMDDDTIPDKTALEELLKAKNTLIKKNVNKIGFLASYVYGPENEPMNVPVIQMKPTKNGYSDWYKHLDNSLVKIKNATFVSILVNHKAIRAVGYPMADYFIWGDDTEYTQRIVTKFGEAFFCGRSKVMHKRFNAKNISIFNEENEGRVDLYYYFFRNSLLNAKKYNPKGNAALHVCEYELKSFKCLFGKKIKYRGRKFMAIQKGIFHYLFKSGKLK